MPRLLRVAILSCLLTVLAGLSATPAADAYTGRCLGGNSGPRCHFWLAKISRYQDGDTIAVHINGINGEKEIRFVGVQAMEQSVYSNNHPERRRGQCHALEATARVEQLIKQSHGRIRLAAQHPSSDKRGRLRRAVAVNIGGHWQDLGAILMSEGHTLWLASNTETVWNQRYNELGQEAALRHVGLWNPTHCGVGPSQGVPLRLWVSWDPLSSDLADINGEFVKIQNLSATSKISLGHWWVRDSDLRRFTFPAGTVLGPGETATLHAGRGRRSHNVFYWGLRVPPFQNTGGSLHIGDGGYLFDPKGDLRAYMIYPCAFACSSPDQGAIRVVAHPEKPEYVNFVNVSNHAVDLYGYAMLILGSSYPFGTNSVLQPGQTMRVYYGGKPSNNTHFTRYWGLKRYMLPDRGGWVRLSTFTDITLGCDDWGSGHC
ncbi:MAG: competence protein ComEC [Thermoleophilaceae bacterium]|jgi:endonuclease YncB( thermonuclease family)|nr:competence protein ComEC [Thermoleophilaceae bacterium]MEA2436533.1 competence protein ComEC [Thermoleophilaceae bacterium]